MINKHSPLPIYYQLEKMIKQQIETRLLKPGDRLPSEREYAETFQVSRMTVRQAITNLVNEGLLSRIKGKGTFVNDQSVVIQNLEDVTGFSEEMTARGMNPSSKMIKFNVNIASSEIARKLNINQGDKIYEIERIRLADNIPMALESSFHPAHLLAGLTEHTASQSIYKYIEDDLGKKIHWSSQTIEARSITKRESTILGIKAGSPVLSIQRIAYISNDVPVEYVHSRYRGDKYKFVINMDRQ